jgi:hypothetical protein
MHEKAAKVQRWFTMSYKQWQETGIGVGVDEEHDEEFVEELMQRRDADGVPEASAADRDVMLDTKRAFDDTINSEPAPPAKKAKGPLLTPPEDEMKGPTLQQIFTLFVLVDKNKGRNLEWLEWLERNCQSYGWGGSERPYESGEEICTIRPNREKFGSGYLKLHGAKELCPNIDTFLSDFVPRRMDADFKDMKRCAATLRALVKFCISQGYLEKDDAKVKHTLKSISVSGKFDAEGVRNSLQQLKNTGYWKRLREQREDDGETDHEAEDEYDYDCADYGYGSEDDDEYPVEGDEFRMGDFHTECSSVRKNGWVFMRSIFNGQARVLLYLPPEVAKLGRAGMLISCMEFVYLGRGVWEPKADDEDFHNAVCANVYPPNN